MNLERALKTDGWMSEPELCWLSEQAQHGDVVEIGSWMGRTTRAMADNKLDGKIYAVDTWEGSEENQEFLKDKPEDYLYHKFNDNLAGAIVSGVVTPVRMPSLVAAKYFANQGRKFSFVFIDAAHDYNSVKADILAWRPLVLKGGVLAGHDFDTAWAGCVRAVRELIAETPNQ